MYMMRWRSLLSLFPIVLLTACASLPPELASSDTAVITDYSTWTETKPSADSEVRLGGVIAGISNQANSTRLEIVNLPIDKAGRPDISQEPQGRFVAYVKGFLDPVTYAPGRLVTLVGKTAASEQGKVGDYAYTFPTMKASGYHLWKVEQRVIMDDVGPYFYPCRGFYCRHFEKDSNEGRVIQTVK